MAWQEHLRSEPKVCCGGCASGTRGPVTVILDSLAEGSSREELFASYPTLNLMRGLGHAARQMDIKAERRAANDPPGNRKSVDPESYVRLQHDMGRR